MVGAMCCPVWPCRGAPHPEGQPPDETQACPPGHPREQDTPGPGRTASRVSMPKVDFAYKKVKDARMPRLPLARREAAAGHLNAWTRGSPHLPRA
eukprot:scaffold8233_cov101-Isochrysis_galbana.AAC.2